MKIVLSLLVILTVASASHAYTAAEIDELFAKYLLQFPSRIGRSANIEELKHTFIERYIVCENHNKEFHDGNTTYELAIDEFSLLSYDELVRLRTGYIPEVDADVEDDQDTNETDSVDSAEDDTGRGGRAVIPGRGGRAAVLPTSFSWLNTYGVVRPVQNQGTCASCWAFASVAAIEGQMALKKTLYEKLSEQEVIECARNQYTGALLGCVGGTHAGGYNHARDKGGITVQANRPYRGVATAGCNTATARATGSKTSKFTVVKANDENAMKEALVNNGPLYVTFYTGEDFFAYKSGVYTDKTNSCSGKSNNHGVLAVGYGNQDGVDYWLVKNSWGTAWGEAGYFKIKRGVNLCGIAKTVNYPTLA